MQLRKVEVTETELRIGQVTYYAGDIREFPKAEADEYIRLGWVKCCETGEQGTRIAGANALRVHDTMQRMSHK